MSKGKVFNPHTQAFDPVYDDRPVDYLTPEQEAKLWEVYEEKTEVLEEVVEKKKEYEPDTMREDIDIIAITRNIVGR